MIKTEDMKEKLKELQNKRYQVACELQAIDNEIKEVEQAMHDADSSLYKGKWYCKEESWWDEFDTEFPSYHIVYVKDVRRDYGDSYLKVFVIKADHYWRLKNFEIEEYDHYPIRELKGMREMDEYDIRDMDGTIKQLLECLFEIRPDIKPESFVDNKEE